MVKHINIKIFGKVQGVFFRTSATEKAENLGLSGFAQNQPDGSVYIEAEGEEKDLDEFLRWCKDGPTMAKVDNVEVKVGPLKNFSDFSI